MAEGFQDYGDFLCMVLAVLQSDVKEHFGAVISVVQCRAMMITWRAIMKMLMMNKVFYIVTAKFTYLLNVLLLLLNASQAQQECPILRNLPSSFP